MSKILVECLVPAAAEKVDVSIPYELPLHESLALIKETYKDNKSYEPDAATVLCSGETGSLYDLSKSPEELGFRIGEPLLLM